VLRTTVCDADEIFVWTWLWARYLSWRESRWVGDE
jgi:hypothetical protein